MIVYLIKWAIALTLLYCTYGLTLRKETFHAFNRVVLWGIVGISALLPLLNISISSPAPTCVGEHHVELWRSTLRSVHSVVPAVLNDSVVGSSGKVEVGFAISLVCCVVSLAILLRNALAIVKVLRLIRNSREVARLGPIRILQNENVPSPFSWMNCVVISPDDLNENGNTLLAHEMGHVRHAHSVDMLLMQVVCSVLWFCPFVWLLRADLCAVHEFQADADALDTGVDIKSYGHLLVDKVAAVQSLNMVNGMNAGNLKRRLRMMYAKPSRRITRMKVLCFVPLLMVVVTAFAHPEVVRQVTEAKHIEDLVGINVSCPAEPATLRGAGKEAESPIKPASLGRQPRMDENATSMLSRYGDDFVQMAKALGVKENVEPKVMMAAKAPKGKVLHFFVDEKEVSREEINKYVIIAPQETEAGEIVAFARPDMECNKVSICANPEMTQALWGVDGCVIHVETPKMYDGVVVGSDEAVEDYIIN